MPLRDAVPQSDGGVFRLAASVAFSVDLDHPQPGRFFKVHARNARRVVAQQTTVAAVQRPVSFTQIDQSIVRSMGSYPCTSFQMIRAAM